jgi:2'-5' RNA ligase
MLHSTQPQTPGARRQLSLFVPNDAAVDFESLRRTLDPVQSLLIPAHVTLCREDELSQMSESELRARLSQVPLKPITLRFARPETFDGHGILLSCIGGASDFRLLREHILGSTTIREQRPHITLAHPRNSKSHGNSLANASTLPEIISITFRAIQLIEQHGVQPWRVLQQFELLR